MTITALEISLNGKVLYTVGNKDWVSLNAQINGFRLTAEALEEVRAQYAEFARDQPLPDSDALKHRDGPDLVCFVGLSDGDRPSSSTGQSYGTQELKLGDEITIRIVQTDKPDDPPESGRDDKLKGLFTSKT